MNDSIKNIYKCTPNQTKKYIIDCMMAGLVPFIQGSPGIGKSAIVKEIAKEYNLEVMDVRLSTCEPCDLTGYPHFENGKAKFLPYEMFPVEGTPLPKGKEGWCLFMDEFNAASKATQSAAYKLILDRMIGMNKLHPRCFVVAAGNLATDKAIVNNLSTAMQSRVIHIEMEVNFDDWLENVALKQDYDPRIIGYLSMYPEKLMDFDPDHSDKTFCSSRTWEFVNRLIKDKKNLEPMINLLVGTISSGVAVSFVQWTKVYENLIKFEDLLKNADKIEIPDDLATKWATVTMIMNKIDKNNIAKVMPFITRLDMSFKILFFKSVLLKHPELKAHPSTIQEMIKLSKYLFEDNDEEEIA